MTTADVGACPTEDEGTRLQVLGDDRSSQLRMRRAQRRACEIGSAPSSASAYSTAEMLLLTAGATPGDATGSRAARLRGSEQGGSHEAAAATGLDGGQSL